MGREVRRVPLDFDHPLERVWPGFLMPASLSGADCEACGGSGYSREAKALQDRWYGYVPFEPWETGSEPYTPDTPEVRTFATRNIDRSPGFYRVGAASPEARERAIVREGERLCGLFNSQWSHHLDQADVDALIAAGRLWDFTRTFVPGEGWKDQDPVPQVTAAQVNLWSIGGFGHDAINCSVAVQARCERAGVSHLCSTCEGRGESERYPGQRAEREAWEPTDPPTGDGWQLWETVSEGSPISPVFESAEALAGWLADPDRPKDRPGDTAPRDWMPYEAALKFVQAGWAPSFVGSSETGLVSGAEYVGFHQGN